MDEFIPQGVISKALIVDSSLPSRQALARDLKSSGIIDELVEAPSVNDAFIYFEIDAIELCVLGPSITKKTAFDFIARCRSLSLETSCSFIVIRKRAADLADFDDIDVDAVISKPYTKEQLALTVFNTWHANVGDQPNQPEPEPVPDEPSVSIRTKVISSLPDQSYEVQLDRNLADLLDGTAFRLDKVSRDISRGKLGVEKDGTPSADSIDALRLAVEKLFPGMDASQDEVQEMFVSAVLEWISDSTRFEKQEAASRFGKRLLELKSKKAAL